MVEPLGAGVTAVPWVVVGCGYTGMRLAERLAGAGARVIAVRRRPEALAGLGAAVEARGADLSEPASLAGLVPAGAVVVDLVAPDEAEAGEPNLVAAAAAGPARRLVYVSSTGVYGRGEGEWVDEGAELAPLGPRGARRLVAETAVLEGCAAAGIEAVTLRVAGIYGPGRGVVARMRERGYRIVGPGDTFVSRIHVHDLCSAILAAGVTEPLPHHAYNVADDEPTTSFDYARQVATALGVPMPPQVRFKDVPTSVAAMLGANRKIANARMKAELGVELAYPTWRDGLAAEIA